MGKFNETAKIAARQTQSQLEQEMVDMLIIAKKPDLMPQAVFEAATWFFNLMEPQRHHEKQQERKDKDGKAYWVWGYADRMKKLLRQFLFAEPKLQKLIVSAKQDGVHWRGDDFDFFIRVIDETEKQKGMGAESYKKAAIQQMKHALLRTGKRRAATT